MEFNNRIDNHLVIVMAIEHYNPLSMIRSLGKRGINPIYIAIKGKGKIASSSKYISETFYVDDVKEAYDLLIDKFSQEQEKPFVLCTDDKTMSYLDLHYSDIKDHFIFFNAGKDGEINKYMDKYAIYELAIKHGLKALDTYCVDRGVIPDNLTYPVITKSISPVVGGWKSDVHICKNEEELLDAYKQIKADKVIIQKYIDKKNEYTIQGFSINEGKDTFFSISTEYNYIINGYYSPFLTFRNADNKEINEKLARIFEEIGFEGLFEVEFLIDDNDELLFEEINFRNSPWSYPSFYLNRPLPELWMRSMLENKIDCQIEPITRKLTAMNEPIDYHLRVDTDKISKAEWLYDFKNADVTFYYDQDDTEPYYLMMNNYDLYK